MAKGLKVGDAVTVRKEMRLRRKDPAYQQGLKRLRPGEIGHIVDMADGRSVIAEFKGTQVTLASQRLDRAEPPVVEVAATEAAPVSANGDASAKPTGAKRGPRGRRPANANSAAINYENPDFIAEVANRLLLSGGLASDPETIVVQVKLSDLPQKVQSQVQNLMRAKLDLGRTPAPVAAGVAGADGAPRPRRGRRPKVQQN